MDQQRTITLLLVEDNRDFAKLVEVFLRKHEPEHFEIVWKENGQEALAEIGKDNRFDLILMDYFLPGQNGLEITRVLREQHSGLLLLPRSFLSFFHPVQRPMFFTSESGFSFYTKIRDTTTHFLCSFRRRSQRLSRSSCSRGTFSCHSSPGLVAGKLSFLTGAPNAPTARCCSLHVILSRLADSVVPPSRWPQPCR